MTTSMGRALAVAMGLALLLTLPGPATAAPGPRTRVLKTWRDVVKVPGGEVARRYEIVFDYGQGLARLLTYDDKGTLLESKDMTAGQPRPSDEEIAEAFGLVKADPVLGRIIARTRAVPEGGFLLEEAEGQPCGPRTRCLHTLWLSADRRGLVRWVVVDLVKQAIAYRSYTPPDGAVLTQGMEK